MTTATMPATDRVPVSDERLRGLRRFNGVMGVLHLVQGVFMIAVSNATTYPIFTNFLGAQFVDGALRLTPSRSCSTSSGSARPWRSSC
jgi:hypothetical protein